jgi:hypothetical protein
VSKIVRYNVLEDEIVWAADRNTLFVNPLRRVVKPQSRLDLLVLRRRIEVVKR